MRACHQFLRDGTADQHQALEATPLMRAIAAGRHDQGDYAAYLYRQYRLHAALEAVLAPWCPSDWVGHRLKKTAWLTADLSALGVAAGAAEPGVAPLTSTGQAFGVLYVLEGATLGLSVVRKRLLDTHPALSVAGRFFDGYGEATGSEWRLFIDRLESMPVVRWSEMLSAARTTFGYFLAVFSDGEPTTH